VKLFFFWGEIGGKHIGKIKLQQIHPMQRKRKNLGLLGACYIISLDCHNYISNCVEHLTHLGSLIFFLFSKLCDMSFDHPFWMVLEFEGAKRFKVCFLNCNNVSMNYVEAIWSSCSFVLQVPFF
jgi:hypothetical protein